MDEARHWSWEATERWLTHVRIPPRARPFVRLAIVAAFVLGVDSVTGVLTHRGVTLHPAVVTAVRLGASVLVLRYPLAGFVLALEVDKWDWFWMDMAGRTDEERALYQSWDKLLDLVTLGAAAFVALRWPDRLARSLVLGAFAWRVVGVAAFLVTGERWLLLVFPNVFESGYLLYLVFRTLSGRARMLEDRLSTVVVVVALLIPKLGAEYVLHIREIRPWQEIALVPWPALNGWLWGAMFYGPALAALVFVMLRAEGRATRGDPEEQLSPL